jgi:hypothetical protein
LTLDSPWATIDRMGGHGTIAGRGVTHRRGGAVLLAAVACVVAPVPAIAATSGVSAGKAALRACHEHLAGGAAAGVDTLRHTASATGLIRARLTGRGGDWDLGVFDARSRRSVAGSAGLGSNELAEGFVR